MIKKIYLEVIISLLIVILCLSVILFEVDNYSSESSVMPFSVLSVAIALSIIWLFQSLYELKNSVASTSDRLTDNQESKKLVVFFCISLVYVISVGFLGFFSSTIIAIPVIALSMGYRNLKTIGIATVLFSTIVFVVFNLFLKVPLPMEIWNRIIGGA